MNKRTKRFNFLKVVVFLLALGVLDGCKVDLYTGVSQKEGNEMLATLLRAGLDAEKQPAKDKAIDILIEESQQDQAIELLLDRGLPRNNVSDLGTVFKKEGLISTPTEENARLVYAISQELTGTLSQLDGAIAVRVHVVLTDKKEKNVKPASAAIFIKYQQDYDFNSYIPQIKELVANSVSDLDYKKISVVLFPSKGMLSVRKKQIQESFLSELAQDKPYVLYVLFGFTIILILATGALGYLYLKKDGEEGKMPEARET